MDSEHVKRVYPGSRRELRGEVFGNLTVERYSRYEDHRTYWLCRCTCGEVVEVPAYRLVNGKRKSCRVNGHNWQMPGIRSEHLKEYSVWSGMRQRCENPLHEAYKNYGGRGIKVCERWKTFANFISDMGPRPTAKHTIEREENSVGYEPMNCVWATTAQQARNKRTNVYVEYLGRRQLLSDLCVELGLSSCTIQGRLKRGWTVGRALTTPVDKKHRKK